MGIISGIGNIYFVYQFIKKLVTPFEKTDAFKLGIIDKDGKILKKRRNLEGSKEKDAYTLSDTLVWNIKKLLGKVPGGKSKIATYGAALFLIKEQSDDYRIDDEELELQFFDQFEKMYNEDLEFDPITLKRIKRALDEDTPTTTTGGMAYRDMPLDLSKPPKGLIKKKFGGIDVFGVDPKLFGRSLLGKKKYGRYKSYVGEDEVGQYITAWARKYPNKPIIVMDSVTGCMQYLRHGK
mgnify:FL=1